MTSQLPQWFTSSIRESGSYPENLVHKSTYPGALTTYKAQLDDIEKGLFVTRDTDVNVPFRDLIDTSSAFDKHKVHDHEELQERLGQASRMDPKLSAVQQDTRCRFIFLYADHSKAPLKITRKMLVRILSYYQVMPSYLDFLLVFGNHKHSRETRFSAFRSESLLGGQNPALNVLGRNGKQFQLCYNLKAVARWTASGQLVPTDSHWSIRQAAIHHQFDVWKGNSLWIITRAGQDIKQRIESMTGKTGRSEDRDFQTPEQCLKSSLAVHLLLCHWASENWRTYFQWLEDTVESATFGVVHGPRGDYEPQQTSSTFHLQKAQNLEEQTTEAIMVLKGNQNVLLSLRDFYHNLRENDLFPLRDTCGSELSTFATQIDSFIYDSNMQIERGRLLADNIAARRTIILQHLQSQATEKMEKLTTSMQKDSLTVRIIAFLTFLYLPATFVSTFFSTDIIKYQDQSSGGNAKETSPSTTSGSFSSVALYRWLQVTLPLTFLTFAAAIFWLRREDRKLKKAKDELPTTEVKT